MLAAVAAAAEAACDSAETKADGGTSVLTAATTNGLGNGSKRNPDMAREYSPYKHKEQMGYDSSASEGATAQEVSRMDHLLKQMVGEQQQVERDQQFREQLAAAAVAEASRLNRPKEHFITIASNGELSAAFSFLLLLLNLSDDNDHRLSSLI